MLNAAALAKDPKLLYRRLAELLGPARPSEGAPRVVGRFVDRLLESLSEGLHIEQGVYYAERGPQFALVRRGVGAAGTFTGRRELDPDVPCLGAVLKHRTYIFRDPSSEESPAHSGVLPPGPAAGILVGDRPARFVLYFRLADGYDFDDADFFLNTIRAALDTRLTVQRFQGSVLEAAEIQGSLIPEHAPELPGYDIAARSIAAEEVGGDFYDFIPFDPDMIGVAVGDASGHGLPAALLVRDVVMGLRMGFEKELKISHVFEKLNRVIHRTTLSARFISVVYGELESNGNFIYINAGHPPPLLFTEGGVHELTVGGTVIGPLPGAAYRRGFAHIDRGATLVMITDGILERRNRAGDPFGAERVREVVEANANGTAGEIVEALFKAADRFGSEAPWEDDATAVVVRRAPRT